MYRLWLSRRRLVFVIEQSKVLNSELDQTKRTRTMDVEYILYSLRQGRIYA